MRVRHGEPARSAHRTARDDSLAAFSEALLGAHPLFEGNWPENLGQPVYGILGNFRMAWHTLRGTMADEIARSAVGDQERGRAAGVS